MVSKKEIRQQDYQRARVWYLRRKAKKEQKSVEVFTSNRHKGTERYEDATSREGDVATDELNVARAGSNVDGADSQPAADGSGGDDDQALAASNVDGGYSKPATDNSKRSYGPAPSPQNGKPKATVNASVSVNPLLDVYVVLKIILKRPDQSNLFRELEGSCKLPCKEEFEFGIDERPQLEVLVARGNLEAETTECSYHGTSALAYMEVCNCNETEWGCKYCGIEEMNDRDEYQVIRFNSLSSPPLSKLKGRLAYMLTKSFCQDMFEFELRLGCPQGVPIRTALVASESCLLCFDDHVQMNMVCLNPKLSGVAFIDNGHPVDYKVKHAMIPGINGNDDNEISPPVLISTKEKDVINGGTMGMSLQCLAMSVPVTCLDDKGDHYRLAGSRDREEDGPGFHSPHLQESSIDFDKLILDVKVNRFRLP